MMELTFTPGPWEAKSRVGNWCAIHSANGVFKNIALVPSGQQDARLIAAAPDLLAALQKYVEHFGDPLRCANAAIAKALQVPPNARI